MANYFFRVLVPAVVPVIVAVSCSAPTSGPYTLATAGLCRAAARISQDVDEARREFYDTVHGPLHGLATETAEVDRSLAARLLTAKESVEFGLDNDTDTLVGSLDELVAAVAASLDEVGYALPACLDTAQE